MTDNTSSPFGGAIWKTLEDLQDLAYQLGFKREDTDRVEGPVVSGNLEYSEDEYLVFQNITRDELLGLMDGQIGKHYDAMTEGDRVAFDLGITDDTGFTETETLESWTGPSLHF